MPLPHPLVTSSSKSPFVSYFLNEVLSLSLKFKKYFISELLASPALDRYCTAVYWVVATMTSTGYGDIHGDNLLEMGKLSYITQLLEFNLKKTGWTHEFYLGEIPNYKPIRSLVYCPDILQFKSAIAGFSPNLSSLKT